MRGVPILAKVVAALAALWLLSEYLRVIATPFDFETYYYAVKAVGQNLDPYDIKNLAAVARHPVTLPFVYPPATLLVFAPFAQLTVPAADWTWRAFSFALLILLIWIWLARFLPRTNAILVSMALAFGFNTAALWGVKMGNVVILEVALLWAAFACYVDDRRGVFTVLVALASVFKIVPIVFLALLLAPSKRSAAKPWLALFGFVALLAIILVPVWIGPSWAHGYHPPSIRPTGVVNPSALGLFDTLLGTGTDEPLSLRKQLNPALGLWVVYAIAIAALSFSALRRAWMRSDTRALILESVYTFVLISPRPMIYSYIMLIPPVLAFGGPFLKGVGGSGGVLALLIAPTVGRRFGFVGRSLLWDHYPFFLALAIWLMHTLHRRRGPGQPTPAGRRRAKTNAHASGAKPPATRNRAHVWRQEGVLSTGVVSRSSASASS
jgi:hypothetical protein